MSKSSDRDLDDANRDGDGQSAAAGTAQGTSSDGCGCPPVGGGGGTTGDGYVEGTEGDDRIDLAYTGDPEGDRIDAGDAILRGEAPDDDIVLAGAGDDTVMAGRGDDDVYGDDGNDILYGESGADELWGEAGNDTLSGGTGSNYLHGGDGDDTFIGGPGADRFSGGRDQDNIDYADSPDAVRVDLTTWELSGGDAANDTITGGIDGVIGSDYDDTLIGFDQEGTEAPDVFTNEFWGRGGNDRIEGRGGNDRLYGGDGDDTISGGEGCDVIDGGDDRDLLTGITAGDTIYGGSGGDDFDTLDLTGAAPEGGTIRLRDVTTDSDGNGYDGRVVFFDRDGKETGQSRFENIEKIVPCFTPGSMIETADGPRAAQDLRPGDMVVTRDNGLQEVRWVGRRDLSYDDLQAMPHLRPVLIRRGALGNGTPERDMLVSPHHRMLVVNSRNALLFAEREVLVAAKHLVNGTTIKFADTLGTSYIHFMCEYHEVVLADGAWSESFQPGDYTMGGIGAKQRAEILELFPELDTSEGIAAYGAARYSLTRNEARLLAE